MTDWSNSVAIDENQYLLDGDFFCMCSQLIFIETKISGREKIEIDISLDSNLKNKFSEISKWL